MQEKFYRIQNIDNKLFSKGGSHVSNVATYRWSKTGKIWATKNALMLHLSQYNSIPANWDVVEYKFDEDGQGSIVSRQQAAAMALESQIKRERRDASSVYGNYRRTENERRRANLEAAVAARK